jgi:hypothetical protein
MRSLALRALLASSLLLSGCASARRLELMREGRALLRHPAPGDASWESRRAIFLGNVDREDPPKEKE